MILLPILRVTLGSDSALPPGALPPRASRLAPHLPMGHKKSTSHESVGFRLDQARHYAPVHATCAQAHVGFHAGVAIVVFASPYAHGQLEPRQRGDGEHPASGGACCGNLVRG